MGKLRLFIGIALDAEYGKTLARVCSPLLQIEAARPTRAEDLHLTLKFLGSTDEALVSGLRQLLESAAAATDQFSFLISGVGSFKSGTIIWAGVSEPGPGDGQHEALYPGLSALSARLDEGCAALGFSREERPYSPHITLLRGKRRVPAPILSGILAGCSYPPLRQEARKITLYQSLSTQHGSHYQELFSVPLRGCS